MKWKECLVFVPPSLSLCPPSLCLKSPPNIYWQMSESNHTLKYTSLGWRKFKVSWQSWQMGNALLNFSSPVTPKLWTDLWLVYSIPEIKSIYNISFSITVLLISACDIVLHTGLFTRSLTDCSWLSPSHPRLPFCSSQPELCSTDSGPVLTARCTFPKWKPTWQGTR